MSANLSFSTPLPSDQRIAKRHVMRSLDTFLHFDFVSKRRLNLIDKTVYGVSTQVLKEADLNTMPWRRPLSACWRRNMDLKRVCRYITNNASDWIAAVANDDQKLLALEQRFAALTRTVAAYNQKMTQKNPAAEPINFVNPLRRVLRLQVHCPEYLDQAGRSTVTYDFSYDRLTTVQELSFKIQEALNKPLSFKFTGGIDLHQHEKFLYQVNAVPSHIFKSAVQNPPAPDDPAAESVKSNLQVVDVSYQDTDWTAVAANFYAQGQNDTMPRVYQQGVADGKAEGYQMAIAAIISNFNKATAD